MGGRVWTHALSLWCFWWCLLQHTHCGPHSTPPASSHPPPCFWTPSIIRWLPPKAFVHHFRHWLEDSMKELERTLTLSLSCSPNQRTVLPVNRSKPVVLQHFYYIFWPLSLLFLIAVAQAPIVFFQLPCLKRVVVLAPYLQGLIEDGVSAVLRQMDLRLPTTWLILLLNDVVLLWPSITNRSLAKSCLSFWRVVT